MHGTAGALLLLALAATATAFAPVGPAAVARRASPRTAVTANYGRRLATTLIKRSSRTSPLSTALASAAGSSEAAPKTFGQKAFETYVERGVALLLLLLVLLPGRATAAPAKTALLPTYHYSYSTTTTTTATLLLLLLLLLTN